MGKEVKINVPEGYEIDKENSTYECIKFKPIEKKRWRDYEDAMITGYWIEPESDIIHLETFEEMKNTKTSYNVFFTEKQAKSALAMARITQIMGNDERFGGVVTDEEWEWNSDLPKKYVIYRENNDIKKITTYSTYRFLAFHTEEQLDLFMKENMDLIKDYYML